MTQFAHNNIAFIILTILWYAWIRKPYVRAFWEEENKRRRERGDE